MNHENKPSSNRFQKTMIPAALVHPDAAPSAHAPSAPSGMLCLPQNIGPYMLTQLLGSGGMSLTYLGYEACQPDLKVVLKIPLADDAGTIQRFHEEIALLKGLNHPGIVIILADGEHDFSFEGEQAPRRKPWFAMEFIGGQSLRQRLLTEGRMSWSEVKRVLADVLETLQYLSDRKIYHRDVKPDNVIYNPAQGRWMLVDFGIAKSLLRNLHLTRTALFPRPGSVEYMSPEQQKGAAVDSRSDMYSLGKTAWEALIGEVPHAGTPYPGEMPELKVPAEVDVLLRKLAASAPEKRFSSPAEALDALLTGADKHERRVLRKEQRRRWRKRTALVVLPFLLLTAGWFLGDYVCARQAADLYLEQRGSPTRTLRTLEQFANDHWFWGRSYVDAKLEELRPLADKEREDMIAEQQTLLTEIAANQHDERVALIRCQNFVKMYGDLFGATRELLVLKAEQDRLAEAVRRSDEIAQVQQVIEETHRLEKEEKLKQALEACKAAQDKFTLAESRLLLEQRGRQIRDSHYVMQLKKIDAQVKPDDANSLLQAVADIEALEKNFGSSLETTRRKKDGEDKFWQLCSARAAKEQKSNQYEKACAHIQFYLDNTRLKLHAVEASVLRTHIKEAEDDHDWERMKHSIDKNLTQNTHVRAYEDAQQYLNKYPRGRHVEDAKASLTRTVAAHADYVHYQSDLDVFNEQLRIFLEKHAAASEQVARLKSRLCVLAQGSISSAMADASLPVEGRRDRLKEIASRFRSCDKQQTAYLNDLLRRAQEYLNDPRIYCKWQYLYALERRPPGPNEGRTPPTIYHVTIRSIDVQLADVPYGKLKGYGNADPRIDIHYGTGRGETYNLVDVVSKTAGSQNMRSFALKGLGEVYFDTASMGSLCVDICDADYPSKSVLILRGFFGAKNFKAAEGQTGATWTQSYSWDDGSKITLTYSLQ